MFELFDLQPVVERLNAMATGAASSLPDVALGVVVFAIFWLGARAVKTAVRRASERAGLATGAGIVFGRLARWSVVFAGLLVAISLVVPSFRAGDLIQLLGIGGVAVGFAFRDVLQNFLAGILVLLQEPFRIGDQIAVAGHEGTVTDIETRATIVRTFDGRKVVIPNGKVFTESVTVNTAYPHRRSQYDVGIGYDDDAGEAKGLMIEAMREVEGVLDEPAPEALVVELGGSAVGIRARWWTDTGKASVVDVQDRVIAAMKETLVDHGIDIPYPIRTVHFHDRTEDRAGAAG